jgi:hypothetical protein
MIVLVAAAGAYVGGGPIWIPLLCGLLGGLNWDHIRGFELRKMVVNASCTTLAAVSAALLARLSYEAIGVSWLGLVISAGVAAGAYWLVDNGAVAVVLTAVDGRTLATHARELIKSETLLVPFAWAGFLAGYSALNGVAIWAAALGVFALLAVADVCVISPHTEALVLPARRLLTLGVATGVVLGIVLGSIKHGTAPLPTLLELALLAFGGSYVLDAVRRGAGKAFLLVTVAATSLMLHSTAPIFAPLVVGAAGAVFLTVTRRLCWSDVERLLSSTLAIVGVAAVMPDRMSSSFGSLLAVGVAVALAGLAGWHLPAALELRLRTDRKSWLTALDALRTDIVLCLLLGVIVGAVGWIGLHAGTAGLSGALFTLGVVAAAAEALRGTSTDGPSPEDLTDIVQSALLDLPPSRLRDDS